MQINFISKAKKKTKLSHLKKVNEHKDTQTVKSHATDRSVFAQLAEGGESILVCLANPVDHLLRVRTQHVALCALLLLLILFLLVPVVPHR